MDLLAILATAALLTALLCIGIRLGRWLERTMPPTIEPDPDWEQAAAELDQDTE